MGIGLGRRHRWCDDEDWPAPYVKPRTPDFIIKKSIYYNKHTIMKVWYKKATNCDGNKILVFQGKFDDPDKFESIEPHFREEGGPIARFHPSQMGWSHAVLFVENL